MGLFLGFFLFFASISWCSPYEIPFQQFLALQRHEISLVIVSAGRLSRLVTTCNAFLEGSRSDLKSGSFHD